MDRSQLMCYIHSRIHPYHFLVFVLWPVLARKNKSASTLYRNPLKPPWSRRRKRSTAKKDPYRSKTNRGKGQKKSMLDKFQEYVNSVKNSTRSSKIRYENRKKSCLEDTKNSYQNMPRIAPSRRAAPEEAQHRASQTSRRRNELAWRTGKSCHELDAFLQQKSNLPSPDCRLQDRDQGLPLNYKLRSLKDSEKLVWKLFSEEIRRDSRGRYEEMVEMHGEARAMDWKLWLIRGYQRSGNLQAARAAQYRAFCAPLQWEGSLERGCIWPRSVQGLHSLQNGEMLVSLESNVRKEVVNKDSGWKGRICGDCGGRHLQDSTPPPQTKVGAQGRDPLADCVQWREKEVYVWGFRFNSRRQREL